LIDSLTRWLAVFFHGLTSCRLTCDRDSVNNYSTSQTIKRWLDMSRFAGLRLLARGVQEMRGASPGNAYRKAV
jgi:hypothetical protein